MLAYSLMYRGFNLHAYICNERVCLNIADNNVYYIVLVYLTN